MALSLPGVSTLFGHLLIMLVNQSWGQANYTDGLVKDFEQNSNTYWRMLIPSGTGYEHFIVLLTDALRSRPLGKHCLDIALKFLTRQLKNDTLWLEFGVWKGDSLRKLAHRAHLLAPRGAKHRVIGFDSFLGLPENWRNLTQAVENVAKPGSDISYAQQHTSVHMSRGSFNLEGQPLVELPGASFVVGWFNETLPRFLHQESNLVSFLHIDCDLYSSTSTVLKLVGSRLTHGAVIVFDDLLNYPGFRKGEILALYEWFESPEFRQAGFTGLQVIGYKGPFVFTDDNEIARWIHNQRGEWDLFPQDAVFRVW